MKETKVPMSVAAVNSLSKNHFSLSHSCIWLHWISVALVCDLYKYLIQHVGHSVFGPSAALYKCQIADSLAGFHQIKFTICILGV